MQGDLSRVAPGDRLNIKASVYNALLDLLRDPRIRGLLGSGAVDMGRETETRVLIKNASGQDLDEGGILGLDSPLINPADNERAYKERRIYYGITPSSSSPFAILTEPIAQNAIGRAVIFGETWCKINVVNEAHHYAIPESTTQLRSASSGLARIVWKEQGLGVKHARVLLQWFDEACCPGGVGGSGGGGGGVQCSGKVINCSAQCMAVDVIDYSGEALTIFASQTSGCVWTGSGRTKNDTFNVQLSLTTGSPNGTTNGGILIRTTGGLLSGTFCSDWDGVSDFPRPAQMAWSGALPQGAPQFVRAYPADPLACGGLGGSGKTGIFQPPAPEALLPPSSDPSACLGCGGTIDTGGCSCSGGCGGCGDVAGGQALELFNFHGTGLLNLMAQQTTGLAVNSIASHYADVGNVGAGEDDLYSDTIPANTLRQDGQAVELNVTFDIAAGATARPRIYFNAIKVYDAGGGITAGITDTIRTVRVIVTRASSTTARATAIISGTADPQYTSDATLTALDFGSAIIVKSTGEGTNNNDIKAVHGLLVGIPKA